MILKDIITNEKSIKNLVIHQKIIDYRVYYIGDIDALELIPNLEEIINDKIIEAKKDLQELLSII